MATLYRAMQLNINPTKDDSNSMLHELWTHTKRKSIGGDYIIGDEAADSFENLINEDGRYTFTVDPDKRESNARQWGETITKGVVDIGELTLAIAVGNRALGLNRLSKFLQKGYQATNRFKKSSKFTKTLINANFNAQKTFVEWSAGEALWKSMTGNDIQQTFYYDGEKGEYVIHPWACLLYTSPSPRDRG